MLPNAYNSIVVQHTTDKKHLIWAKYSVTSYRVIDLVSGRQTMRFKEPSVPSAMYQHQPSQSQRQTSVPLVCSSATITIQVAFPTKRHHCTLDRYSTGTTSKRLQSRGSQAPSHNRPKSSTNSPLTDLEHSDALVPRLLRRYRSRQAASAVD